MPKQRKESTMKMCIWYLALFCCAILMSCYRENTSPGPPDETELYNTQWLFRAFEVLGDTIEFLPADHQYKVTFGESLQGKTDPACLNIYGAAYVIRPPGGIAIDGIFSTRALCRESYWRYLRELEQSGSYTIEGGKLYLWSLDGSKRLVFDRIQE